MVTVTVVSIISLLGVHGNCWHGFNCLKLLMSIVTVAVVSMVSAHWYPCMVVVMTPGHSGEGQEVTWQPWWIPGCQWRQRTPDSGAERINADKLVVWSRGWSDTLSTSHLATYNIPHATFINLSLHQPCCYTYPSLTALLFSLCQHFKTLTVATYVHGSTWVFCRNIRFQGIQSYLNASAYNRGFLIHCTYFILYDIPVGTRHFYHNTKYQGLKILKGTKYQWYCTPGCALLIACST